MKIARGNTRKIIVMVGEIQSLVSSSKGHVMNDRDPNSMDKILPALDKAFELCLEITGMYYQIETQANKACSGQEPLAERLAGFE